MKSARLRSTSGMLGMGRGLGGGLMMAEVVASRLLRRNIVDDGCAVVAEIVVDQAECGWCDYC